MKMLVWTHGGFLLLYKKLEKGRKFDLEDFREQLNQMASMGGITSMLDKLPGMNQLPDDVDLSDAEGELKRIEAIIYSMTPHERRYPKVIKRSRKIRIANGSGTSVQEINQLLRQFRDMQKMMKQMQKRGGMRNLAKMLGGGGRGLFR